MKETTGRTSVVASLFSAASSLCTSGKFWSSQFARCGSVFSFTLHISGGPAGITELRRRFAFPRRASLSDQKQRKGAGA